MPFCLSSNTLYDKAPSRTPLPARPSALAIFIAAAIAAMPAVTQAETFTYTGDGNDLKADPGWAGFGDNHLYPGSRNNPSASGNTVIIDYDPNAAGMKNPNKVYGGLSQSEASYNTVILRNGKLNNETYGGGGHHQRRYRRR